MIHELKSWTEPFQVVWTGGKTFEIREEDDRVYSVGDILVLREFEPCAKCAGRGWLGDPGYIADCCAPPHGSYLPRSCRRVITYLVRGQWGIPRRASFTACVQRRREGDSAPGEKVFKDLR